MKSKFRLWPRLYIFCSWLSLCIFIIRIIQNLDSFTYMIIWFRWCSVVVVFFVVVVLIVAVVQQRYESKTLYLPRLFIRTTRRPTHLFTHLTRRVVVSFLVVVHIIVSSRTARPCSPPVPSPSRETKSKTTRCVTLFLHQKFTGELDGAPFARRTLIGDQKKLLLLFIGYYMYLVYAHASTIDTLWLDKIQDSPTLLASILLLRL